jgi:hypothetical protein
MLLRVICHVVRKPVVAPGWDWKYKPIRAGRGSSWPKGVDGAFVKVTRCMLRLVFELFAKRVSPISLRVSFVSSRDGLYDGRSATIFLSARYCRQNPLCSRAAALSNTSSVVVGCGLV